jgi:hypothetical protein
MKLRGDEQAIARERFGEAVGHTVASLQLPAHILFSAFPRLGT